MAPPGDEDRPWAELAAIYELIYKRADFDEAVSGIVDRYSGAALKRLYELTVHWGPTFVGQSDGDEKSKRAQLTRHILKRGIKDKRAS